MSSERAKWMEEISAYVNEQGLKGKEVLLYGYIPAVSYYLSMPPVFNSWSDLRSFSVDAMTKEMDKLAEETKNGKEPPVVILEMQYGADLLAQSGQVITDGNGEAMEGNEEPAVNEELTDEEVILKQKFELILDYMEEFEYGVTFYNEKFVVLEAGK